jgi:hypothetical protein
MGIGKQSRGQLWRSEAWGGNSAVVEAPGGNGDYRREGDGGAPANFDSLTA